jgi:hypothetical protein
MNMGSLSSFAPPANPSADALGAALALLAIAADPQATAARLAELTDHMEAVRAAHAEAVTERKAAEDAAAALGNLVEREAKVTADQAALDQGYTQLSVASSALHAREQVVAKRETEVSKAAADLTSREQALADRLASYRQALA